MPDLTLNGIPLDDTFAEAFGMAATAVIITADTPDGRPGMRVLLFGFDQKGLGTQLTRRLGQCVLTSPGSACYAGAEGTTRLKMGANLRYFADGHQIAK